MVISTMRHALALLAILIVVGTAAIHYGFTRDQIGEWHAAPLPYPGAGFASYDTFELYRGGRFALHVLSPITDQERKQLVEESASTKLHLVITGRRGFRLDKTIESLHVGSWSAVGRTFSPDEVWVLPAGQYEVRIENLGSVPPIFRDRGALIYLERMEPVGPDLGIELSKFMGYALLFTATVFAVFLAVRPTAFNHGNGPPPNSP